MPCSAAWLASINHLLITETKKDSTCFTSVVQTEISCVSLNGGITPHHHNLINVWLFNFLSVDQLKGWSWTKAETPQSFLHPLTCGRGTAAHGDYSSKYVCQSECVSVSVQMSLPQWDLVWISQRFSCLSGAQLKSGAQQLRPEAGMSLMPPGTNVLHIKSTIAWQSLPLVTCQKKGLEPQGIGALNHPCSVITVYLARNNAEKEIPTYDIHHCLIFCGNTSLFTLDSLFSHNLRRKHYNAASYPF